MFFIPTLADHIYIPPTPYRTTERYVAHGDGFARVEFYSYQGDDRNIAKNFGVAICRSAQFFDKYVKNAPAP